MLPIHVEVADELRAPCREPAVGVNQPAREKVTHGAQLAGSVLLHRMLHGFLQCSSDGPWAETIRFSLADAKNPTDVLIAMQ